MKELRFTETHEWAKQTGEEVIIGITEHAQQLLGDLVFVELPSVGDTYNAKDELGVVESVKAASDFYAPISGEVIAVNEAVANNPALVNTDPYGDGWLVKIKPSHAKDMDAMLTDEQYQDFLAQGH